MAKNKVIVFLLIGWLASQKLLAQDYYYFVSFADKQNSSYSIDQPLDFLSPKAIERRQNQNIAITEEDLPVSHSYIESVKSKGVDIFEQSRWFNGVIVRATQPEAEQLKSETFVAGVTYLAPQNYAGRRTGGTQFLHLDSAPSDSLFQNEILGVKEMHNDGYYGENMIIAVLDGGFRGVDSASPFSHLFTENKLLYAYDFVSKTTDVYKYSQHGTKVLSTMAAQKEDSYQGIAPDASFMLFVTENVPTEYRIEEYYWLIAAERADSAGVDIISTSLGYYWFDDPDMDYTQDDLNGATAVVTRAANIASDKGIVLVTSSGNEANVSWGTITFPSDMYNGLSVGSIDSDYGLSYFSSFGPTSDGRVKPEVVAMGGSTYLVSETGNVTNSSGTSFAAPQVAALAAGVWEAYPNFSAKEIVNAIKMSADNAASPSNGYGYGIPSYQAIKNFLEAEGSNLVVDVYPNPIESGSDLKVKIIDPQETDRVTLEFFESTGKKLSKNVIEVSWRENEAVLTMDQLPKGIYFMKVLFDSGSEAFRIVKL